MRTQTHILNNLKKRLSVIPVVIAFVLSTIALPVQAVYADPGGITSMKNFRDAASSSQVLKTGELYRSAEFSNLTSSDKKKLSSLLSGGVIIDLRTAAQRQKKPDPSFSGLTSKNIPINGILDQTPMVADAKRRTQLRKALRLAANTDGPVLVHCVAGKDRTGWTVAMIMYISGANDSQVMTEYMKSSEAFPDGVKESWLNNGLKAARSKYGSITKYLKKGVGLTDSDIQKIRNKFALNGANDNSGDANSPSDPSGSSDDANTPGEQTDSSSGQSTSFRIASYNILGAGHTGTRSTHSRAGNAIDAILGKTGNASFDVVGVQELVKGDNQYNLFNSGLIGYDHSNEGIPNTIYWKSSRFKQLKGGSEKYPYFSSSTGLANWVLLQDKKSGQKFYVINHHPPAWGVFGGNNPLGAIKREKTAHIVTDWAEQTYKQTKLPVFIIGDLNSTTNFRRGRDDALKGDRSRLPYCIYTKNGIFRYSFDAASGRTGACPLKQNPPGFRIDHVLVSTGVKVRKTGKINVPRASDHDPVYADVVIGSGGPNDGGGGNGGNDGGGNDGNNGGGGTQTPTDTTAPNITLTAPAEGIKINSGLNIAANANDNVAIDRVEFYRDDKLIVVDRATPYIKRWNSTSVPKGTYSVYAVAYDTSGNHSESNRVNVWVDHSISQKSTKVELKQDQRDVTIGMIGSCVKNPKGKVVNTSTNFGDKSKILAGLEFSAQCDNSGSGVDIEINLGDTYNLNNLSAYKGVDDNLRDITSKVTFANMETNGKTTTFAIYSITDGGELDEDNSKDGKYFDPVYIVESATAVNPSPNTNTTTTSSQNGTVIVTTADGNTVTANADGTIAGRGVSALPNTGASSGVILAAVGAMVVSTVVIIRRKRKLARQALAANSNNLL